MYYIKIIDYFMILADKYQVDPKELVVNFL